MKMVAQCLMFVGQVKKASAVLPIARTRLCKARPVKKTNFLQIRTRHYIFEKITAKGQCKFKLFRNVFWCLAHLFTMIQCYFQISILFFTCSLEQLSLFLPDNRTVQGI